MLKNKNEKEVQNQNPAWIGVCSIAWRQETLQHPVENMQKTSLIIFTGKRLNNSFQMAREQTGTDVSNQSDSVGSSNC